MVGCVFQAPNLVNTNRTCLPKAGRKSAVVEPGSSEPRRTVETRIFVSRREPVCRQASNELYTVLVLVFYLSFNSFN